MPAKRVSMSSSESIATPSRPTSPGELAHRPELAAVHRRIDAARERIDARVAEVALVVDVDVVGRIERLVLEPGDRREELAFALGLRLVELTLPLGGRAGPRERILCGGHLVPLPEAGMYCWEGHLADSTGVFRPPAVRRLCRYSAPCERSLQLSFVASSPCRQTCLHPPARLLSCGARLDCPASPFVGPSR